MTSAFVLPDGERVRKLLADLFDGLEVKPGGDFDQSAASGAWFGVFVSDTGVAAALCGADAELAASFGAALSMLPVPAAQEAAKTRSLNAVMVGNVREVMNICSRLVMDATSAHIKLEEVYPRQSMPAQAAGLLAAARARAQFRVSVPKYGGGMMTLLTI